LSALVSKFKIPGVGNCPFLNAREWGLESHVKKKKSLGLPCGVGGEVEIW